MPVWWLAEAVARAVWAQTEHAYVAFTAAMVTQALAVAGIVTAIRRFLHRIG